MVAITQPRRVAALSTSQRVREELCLPANTSLVAHRIRYSSTASPNTKLVFMTDGVLLRELAADFLLSKYSVVVIDEAHERGVNTDVLIGVLSRVAKLRESQWKSGKKGAKVSDLSYSQAVLCADKLCLSLFVSSSCLRLSEFRISRRTQHFSPILLQSFTLPLVNIPLRFTSPAKLNTTTSTKRTRRFQGFTLVYPLEVSSFSALVRTRSSRSSRSWRRSLDRRLSQRERNG